MQREIPPRGLEPMSAFDPAQPAVLHDSLNDTIIPWTGEHQAQWKAQARPHADGVIEWDGLLFDGWGEALGG